MDVSRLHITADKGILKISLNPDKSGLLLSAKRYMKAWPIL